MARSAKLFLFFFFKIFKFLFIYLWLCWVFVSVRGLSLVAASGGHSSSRCAGLSLSRPLSLRSTGSRRAGSAIVAYGPSCSAAFGIFPDQGSNPCPLHWQADSQPLRHQGSPLNCFLPLKYGHPSITFEGRALPRQVGRSREVNQEQAGSRSSLAMSSLPRGVASSPNHLSQLTWQPQDSSPPSSSVCGRLMVGLSREAVFSVK